MEKKSVLIIMLFLVVILSLNYVFAASNDTSEKSYTCLKNQLGDNCGNTQSTQQAAFSLLAMGYDSSIQSQCKKSLKDKLNDDCWPELASSSSCSIKATAIATIALKTVGENVDSYVDWLLEKKKSSTGLIWYLEIDASNETECDINGRTFIISENKKILGTDPSGLIKSYDDYWFQILDTSRNFTISCDRDFLTTLIYQKRDTEIYNVLGVTHSAAAGDSTNEKVESYCFSGSSTCDYEATLWTAIALQKAGEEITSYIPYLSANAEDNKKYLPSAFLYMLNRAEDSFYTDLIGLQKQGKYWDESGNKYFDTALAILALGDDSNADAARDYLFSIRETSGCWRSDTAFILYSSFTKAPSKGGGSTSRCEDFNYKCVSASECDIENKLDVFCSGSNICCKSPAEKPRCSEKEGIICESNQQCSGDTVIAGDTRECCLGSCQDIQLENECTNELYSCRISCLSNEEEKISLSSYCSNNNKCCGAKSKTSSSSWTLIIILIILILLVILAIIFRNKLKIWWFKMKSGFKTKPGPGPTTRPSPPYRPLSQRPRQMIPRQGFFSSNRRPVKTGKSDRDNEFEETMKKLRDMSK